MVQGFFAARPVVRLLRWRSRHTQVQMVLDGVWQACDRPQKLPLSRKHQDPVCRRQTLTAQPIPTNSSRRQRTIVARLEDPSWQLTGTPGPARHAFSGESERCDPVLRHYSWRRQSALRRAISAPRQWLNPDQLEARLRHPGLNSGKELEIIAAPA